MRTYLRKCHFLQVFIFFEKQMKNNHNWYCEHLRISLFWENAQRPPLLFVDVPLHAFRFISRTQIWNFLGLSHNFRMPNLFIHAIVRECAFKYLIWYFLCISDCLLTKQLLIMNACKQTPVSSLSLCLSLTLDNIRTRSYTTKKWLVDISASLFIVLWSTALLYNLELET